MKMTPKSLMSLFTIALVLALGNHVDAVGIDDNEVEQYEEPVSMVGGVKIYEKERLCALVGGSCVHRSDCYPDEITSVKGLCTTNRHYGVECCYRIKFPKKVQKCEEDFYGACMSRCHPGLKRPADDCETGTHCCVLVN